MCRPRRMFLYVLNQYFDGSSGIRFTGTNFHQTWAEICLNMVTDTQATKGALDSSNQTLKKKKKSLKSG